MRTHISNKYSTQTKFDFNFGVVLLSSLPLSICRSLSLPHSLRWNAKWTNFNRNLCAAANDIVEFKNAAPPQKFRMMSHIRHTYSHTNAHTTHKYTHWWWSFLLLSYSLFSIHRYGVPGDVRNSFAHQIQKPNRKSYVYVLLKCVHV